tara:strand:+ start:414 stop:866 length:453 start_codon:yes stop_codon:yes gene_type:complete
MTNLNLKEYLSTKTQNGYIQNNIAYQLCNSMTYLIKYKSNDIADLDAIAKEIMSANIVDQKTDGNTVVQSSSSTGAVGAPHYDEAKMEDIHRKILGMEKEKATLHDILIDAEAIFKSITGNEYVPRNKKGSNTIKVTDTKSYFQKRYASK